MGTICVKGSAECKKWFYTGKQRLHRRLYLFRHICRFENIWSYGRLRCLCLYRFRILRFLRLILFHHRCKRIFSKTGQRQAVRQNQIRDNCQHSHNHNSHDTSDKHAACNHPLHNSCSLPTSIAEFVVASKLCSTTSTFHQNPSLYDNKASIPLL